MRNAAAQQTLVWGHIGLAHTVHLLASDERLNLPEFFQVSLSAHQCQQNAWEARVAPSVHVTPVYICSASAACRFVFILRLSTQPTASLPQCVLYCSLMRQTSYTSCFEHCQAICSSILCKFVMSNSQSWHLVYHSDVTLQWRVACTWARVTTLHSVTTEAASRHKTEEQQPQQGCCSRATAHSCFAESFDLPLAEWRMSA